MSGKVLITGANSYIGTNVEKWLQDKNEDIQVTTIDTTNEQFLQHSFKGYDSVFHVAGIAHVSADPSKEALYYKVNRDLAIETAKKAKEDGVGQFIFMSSIIVYGDASKIDCETKENPTDFYGKSKLQAEHGLCELASETFKIVIIRPPMIYGKNSKGNYPKLAKMATKLPFFPRVKNQRSMLYIENLCELIYLIIKTRTSGFFYPQNKEYVNTSELVKQIALCHGKKMFVFPGFGKLIACFRKKSRILKKVFGDLVYEKSMSQHFQNTYCVVDFEDSICKTER